ncbi:patatin-like phospholipase family protein [Inquilinus limosus]|uniref:patatin-like phospholipase family protein n=1 Tax=Inquilinus limosus TaxID=171674 RepID=UPI003F13E68B
MIGRPASPPGQRRWRWAAPAAIVAVFLSACAYPTRNEALTGASRPRYDYQQARVADAMPDTLVIVTASGGGARATALALSVLQAMDDVKLRSGTSTLAKEVDIVSSVSGGSVAAAYFALNGPGKLDLLKTNFLQRDVMTTLMARGLNPVGLATLSTPGVERIDLLIDYLDRDTVFGGKTFAAFLDGRDHPYLILNAADMVEGTPFSFTQYTMDLLCSDLTRIKIATAVAASAAFPVALSPVTLKNYSTAEPACDPESTAWVQTALETDWRENPGRLSRGRAAQAYLTGAKSYVHLLDGGIVDNLGVAEPLRLLTTSDDVSSNFLEQLQNGEIKKLVFIMVNARSSKPSELDHAPDTPGEISTLVASIYAPIDRAAASGAIQVRTLIREQLEGWADDAERQGTPQIAKRLRALSENAKFVSVELDAIEPSTCRQKMQGIPTSWTLSEEQLEATLKIGRALFFDNAKELVATVGGTSPAPPGGNVARACGQIGPAPW